jgi:hypothetical protein
MESAAQPAFGPARGRVCPGPLVGLAAWLCAAVLVRLPSGCGSSDWHHRAWSTSRETDVAPVKILARYDVILEVGPAGGTLEAAGAATRNDRVLAASANF